MTRFSLCLAVLLVAVSGRTRGDYEAIDSPMYKSPDLPPQRLITIVPERARELWIRAMARPEADLRLEAARAVLRAQGKGVKGLDGFTPSLRKALEGEKSEPVQLALARALVALDDREAAAILFRVAQAGDRQMRDVVEPALARWDHRPARAVWLQRLDEAMTPQRDLVRAMQGLAVVQEGKAGGRLRELVLGPHTPGPIRLEAARALAALRDEGLEKDAADVAALGLSGRLAGATLLRRHRGDGAVKLLQRMVRDKEPAVAAVAAGRLLEIDAKLLVDAVGLLKGSADAGLRRLAVEVLRRAPGERHIAHLADLLDDPDTAVRVSAGEALRGLAARKENGKQVIDEATRMLATRQWRALEQATILLVRLDHKPASRRLVELLSFERPEVFVTAAWGLRKLAVADTLPAVQAHAAAQLKRLEGGEELPVAFVDHQLSQLNQFLGQAKYEKADATLRRFLRRTPATAHHESRAAAVWALGLIHEGKSVPALAGAFEFQLNDTASMPPEDSRVRGMSAISLGRLKAKGALGSLRMHYGAKKPMGDPVHDACGWAIARINGEAFGVPAPLEQVIGNVFLIPSD